MTIESTSDEATLLRVVTTGAEFVFHKDTNRIELFQRIPARRLLGSVSGLPLAGIKLVSSSTRTCAIADAGGWTRLTIGADSLLRILPAIGNAGNITIQGTYQPQFRQHVGQDFFLPDEQGGLGFYLISGNAVSQPPPSWEPGWSIRYQGNTPVEL